MTQVADLKVVDFESGTMVGLPLSNGSETVFVLPHKDASLEEIVSSDQLLHQIRSYKSNGTAPDQTLIKVPKYECELDAADLSPALCTAGFRSVSSPNLESMTGKSLSFASFVHGAKITVDENGLEAGSYLLMAVDAGAPDTNEPPKPREFVLNRPFAFAVCSASNQPLFIGTVLKPQIDPAIWKSLDTQGEIGTEGGKIVADWEAEGLGRVTLERFRNNDGDFAVTCGLYGLTVHTFWVRGFDKAFDAAMLVKKEIAAFSNRCEEEDFDAGRWCEQFVDRRG